MTEIRALARLRPGLVMAAAAFAGLVAGWPGGRAAAGRVSGGSHDPAGIASERHVAAAGHAAAEAEAAVQDPSTASVGDLVGSITKDLSTLMRQELDLAKAEVKQEAIKSGKAAGMYGMAGFAGTWCCSSHRSRAGGGWPT